MSGRASGGSSQIDPGMNLTEFLRLTPECDLSWPGKYVVRLSRPLDHEKPDGVILTSNEITITVIPKTQDAPQ